MQLLPCFFDVVLQWRKAFRDHRSHRRALRFALPFLVCLGRRTISRGICAQGRQFQAWSSDYRLFSHNRWDAPSLFDAVLEEAHPLMSDQQPLVVALDDTPCRKTGKMSEGDSHHCPFLHRYLCCVGTLVTVPPPLVGIQY